MIFSLHGLRTTESILIKHLTLILCFLLTTSTLAAQIVYPKDQGKWEFSGLAGWGWLSGSKSFATPIEDGTSKIVTGAYDAGWVFGMRLSENMGQRFAGELGYSASNNSITLGNLQSVLPPLEIAQTVHTFSYSAVLHLADRQKAIRPYGLIGAGASLFAVSGDSQSEAVVQGIDLKNRWKFAFAFGGGVKWLLGKKWGLQFDFRDSMTSVPDYGLPRSATVSGGQDGVAFRPNGNLHDLQVSVGFIYRFAGR